MTNLKNFKKILNSRIKKHYSRITKFEVGDLSESYNWIKLPLRQRKKFSQCYTEKAYDEIRRQIEENRPIPKKNTKKKNKKNKIKTEATLAEVLKLLNKILTLNKNVKKNAYTYTPTPCWYCGWCWNHKNWSCVECWGESFFVDVDYDLRDSEYHNKTKYIKTAIQLISENRLPIKYWKNNWVIYFEYCGSQVSFHDPKDKIQCKPFNWEWSWKRNKELPFII